MPPGVARRMVTPITLLSQQQQQQQQQPGPTDPSRPLSVPASQPTVLVPGLPLSSPPSAPGKASSLPDPPPPTGNRRSHRQRCKRGRDVAQPQAPAPTTHTPAGGPMTRSCVRNTARQAGQGRGAATTLAGRGPDPAADSGCPPAPPLHCAPVSEVR